MQTLQLDNTNMLAVAILPHMINSINNLNLNEKEKEIFKKIKSAKNWYPSPLYSYNVDRNRMQQF